MTTAYALENIEILNNEFKKTLGRDTFKRISRHQDRVAKIAKSIGDYLNLTSADSSNLEIASRTHDLGKTEWPKDILRGKRNLSKKDWEIIKQHPCKTVQILEKRMPKLSIPVKEIALYHHKKFDGTGYPETKLGKIIPIESSIIQAADSFEAMVTNRPYRTKKHTVRNALAELEKSKGKQYHPKVIDALIKLYSKSEVEICKTVKILYVDDNKDLITLAKISFEINPNYEVITAENGKIALDLLAENVDTDIIFCDYDMPIMNGLEFSEQLKADPEYSHIPIVICTAGVSRLEREALEKVSSRIRVKPIDDDYLVSDIKEFCE